MGVQTAATACSSYGMPEDRSQILSDLLFFVSLSMATQ